ncbi:hypothetical protein [Aquimarina rhabdastrellae]
MKRIFTLILVFTSISFFAQDKKITFLDLAGNYIQVPKSCKATSEYELLACDGTSIQWSYYSEDLLQAVSEQIITSYEQSAAGASKSAFSAKSYGGQLTGVKFEQKSGSHMTYQYFLSGKIKDKGVMMTVGTNTNITSMDELSGILKLIFEEIG